VHGEGWKNGLGEGVVRSAGRGYVPPRHPPQRRALGFRRDRGGLAGEGVRERGSEGEGWRDR